MLGSTPSGRIIGVAPEAKWIGCRNMDRGYGRPHTYIECLQFCKLMVQYNLFSSLGTN